MPTGIYKRTSPSPLKGRKVSEEHRRKIIQALIGRPVSASTRAKIGAKNRVALLGKKQSPTTIAKRVAQYKGERHWLFGKHHSGETRKKISIGKSGKSPGEWSGFVTPLSISLRRKFQREMQKEVFERDNYTCQLCGVRGVNLQVDHIQPWADYVELRFSMDNCRTLCAKCHYQITFGRPMPENIKGWGHNFLKRGVD
jgi:hypothetical protein